MHPYLGYDDTKKKDYLIFDDTKRYLAPATFKTCLFDEKNKIINSKYFIENLGSMPILFPKQKERKSF